MGIRKKRISGDVGIWVFVSLLFLLPTIGVWAEEKSPAVDVFEALDNRSDSLEELRLRVRFNQPMDRKSVELATSMLHEYEFNWPFTISWEDDATMVLNPSGPLKMHVPIGIIIRHEASTQDGFGMEKRYVGYVMTGLSKPSILETEPKDGTETRTLDGPIRIVFSQGMDQFSTEYAFSLENEGRKEMVAGKITWNEDSTVLHFTPNRSLERDTWYVCRISADARDIYAQGMLDIFIFRFQTR
jgi:hypothetical protein